MRERPMLVRTEPGPWIGGPVRSKGGEMAEGYCVKCKEKREIKDPEEVIMKNKMKAMKGTCTKCGTKVFKIVGKA